MEIKVTTNNLSATQTLGETSFVLLSASWRKQNYERICDEKLGVGNWGWSVNS